MKLTFPPPVLTGSGSTGSQNASQPKRRPEVELLIKFSQHGGNP